MTKSRGILAPRQRWEAWQLDMLRRHYPDKKADWVARAVRRDLASVYAMAKKLGIGKSEAFKASPEAQRMRRGDEVGKAFRFQPGHVPANKGVRGRPSNGRMATTQFKLGQIGHNHLEVGTVNTDTAGYPKVKLREPNVWGYLAQLVWASTHDWPLPKGHVLRYRDGNRGNCHPDNLAVRPRSELAHENQMHHYPEEIKQLIYARRSLMRKINDHEQDRRRPKRALRPDDAPGGREQPSDRDRTIEGDG